MLLARNYNVNLATPGILPNRPEFFRRTEILQPHMKDE